MERIPLGAPTTVREPVDEIMFTGVSDTAEPIAISGRLSYINHGDAWTIVNNAADKRRLTFGHNLDARVFGQSLDGKRLIFTSETDPADAFFNELWLLRLTAEDAEPARMTPTDVLYAEWRPRASHAIAYSTGERRPGAPGFRSLNNLWLMSIDFESARAVSIQELLPESAGGVYGWRGKNFAWAPDGDKIAWAQADGIGLVDLERTRLAPVIEHAVFQSAANWVWLSPLSWSYDGELLAAVQHGAPLGDEPAETSPVFDVVVASAESRFTATVVPSAGMWAAPAFSPNVATSSAEHSRGYLAWLQARAPHMSMNSDYDLMLADRDGSNRRRLFPPDGEPGIRKHNLSVSARDFVWSPDGQFIALIYHGNLWLIEIETAAATQVTFDGNSSNPVWSG